MSVCLCAADRTIRPLDSIVEIPNATNSKFGKHVSRNSLDMTCETFSKRGAHGHSHVVPKFLSVYANNSETFKATDFKFDVHVPRDMPDSAPENFFSEMGRGQGRVTP